MRVLSKNTEHHGGDPAVRIVPTFPERKELLAEAFEAAEGGAVFIVPRCARAGLNPRTHLEQLVAKAGRETRPALVQNLRASCETDWVERYPSHVVARWLGQPPKVAAQHYLMPREHHFEDVVNGGDASPVQAARTGQPSADQWSAHCGAPNVRIAVQHASASAGTRSHETTAPAATNRVAAGSACFFMPRQRRIRDPKELGIQMAGTGREQPAFRAGNPGDAVSCDAKCDAISPDRVQLLAHAVILVAGMRVPEPMRAAVLDRVIADLGEHSASQPEG